MFIFTARLSKRKAALLVLGAAAGTALVLFLLSGLLHAGTAQAPRLSDNAARIDYLRTWGWEVAPEPLETFQLLVPKELPASCAGYNRLQKAQGFDLSRCCGRQVERYTYAVTNYPGRPEGVQVNLYVCGEAPAAGDVIAAGEDGFQAGLRFPAPDGASARGSTS